MVAITIYSDYIAKNRLDNLFQEELSGMKAP